MSLASANEGLTHGACQVVAAEPAVPALPSRQALPGAGAGALPATTWAGSARREHRAHRRRPAQTQTMPITSTSAKPLKENAASLSSIAGSSALAML